MRVLLGMSGGFDSTYAALKLIEDGYSVEGAVLVMHDCTDVAAAEYACAKIGIPLHVIDVKKQFASVVVADFLNEYKNARTPNPCIICNREIKLKYLYLYAMENGFDKIATGHYARVVEKEIDGKKRYTVGVGLDKAKDQSYMLARVDEQIISKLILPLGCEIKKNLRESASDDMPAKDQKDSLEICFIPDNNHVGYLNERLGASPIGNFVDTAGNVLGKHKGLYSYTVGQRKGLGIALGKRMFVTEINANNNTVTLDAHEQECEEITVKSVVYTAAPEYKGGDVINADVKIRYSKAAVPANVTVINKDTLRVNFASPVKSPTPGQSAVLYVDNCVLAAGIIDG